MTLNARKSCANSFLKIKTNNNWARFSKNPQNSEKFDSETTPYNVGSVLRRLFSTAEYWTASAVLMLSLCSTDAIPLQYWCYPSTVLMLSPAVLMLSLHSTDAIPRSTDDIPPQYWCYPPQYWTASAALMLSPAVLNSLCSTDAIPPQYWIASAILNSLRSTEPTLYGVETGHLKLQPVNL